MNYNEILVSNIKNIIKYKVGLSSYKDDSGKNNKMYLMTKDGFSLLAIGC